MSLCFCGSGLINGCCPTCAPATSIYQGECQDPGTLTVGRFLPSLDFKFCERRLSSGEGFLVSNINGSGNAGFTWTTTPQVQLTDYQATEDIAFGQLVVMGSDFRWRALVPPVTLGLFMQTDATGNLILGDPPAAVVPDPLAINDLSVANAAIINDLTTNGTVTLNNLASGTVVNLLGVDVSNELVLQSLTAGIAGSMFFESPTSPNAGAPNDAKINGDYLVIGNRLFDSGANLISVTTSEAITVNVTGKYLLLWSGQVYSQGAAAVGFWLEVNGVIVNQGTGRTATTPVSVTETGTATMFEESGMELRDLTAGDVLKLQFSKSGGAGTFRTYEVRLIAIKFGD